MTVDFGQSVVHLPLVAPLLALGLLAVALAVCLVHRPEGDDWIDERWGRGAVLDRWEDGEV